MLFPCLSITGFSKFFPGNLTFVLSINFFFLIWKEFAAFHNYFPVAPLCKTATSSFLSKLIDSVAVMGHAPQNDKHL